MNDSDVRALQAGLRTIHKLGRASTPPVAGVARVSSRALGAVARRGEAGIRPGEIADELGMTTSNVAAALRELDRAGYIDRRRSDSDGRQVLVRLTEHGGATVAEYRALRVDGLREAIEAGLDAEEQVRLAAAIPLLAKIADGYWASATR